MYKMLPQGIVLVSMIILLFGTTLYIYKCFLSRIGGNNRKEKSVHELKRQY